MGKEEIKGKLDNIKISADDILTLYRVLAYKLPGSLEIVKEIPEESC
jgi:hypothetical protein